MYIDVTSRCNNNRKWRNNVNKYCVICSAMEQFGTVTLCKITHTHTRTVSVTPRTHSTLLSLCSDAASLHPRGSGISHNPLLRGRPLRSDHDGWGSRLHVRPEERLVHGKDSPPRPTQTTPPHGAPVSPPPVCLFICLSDPRSLTVSLCSPWSPHQTVKDVNQ